MDALLRTEQLGDVVSFLQGALAGVNQAAATIKEMPLVGYDMWLDLNPGAVAGFSIWTYNIQIDINGGYFIPNQLALVYSDPKYRLFCNVNYGSDMLDEQGRPTVSGLVLEFSLNGMSVTLSGNDQALLGQYASRVAHALEGYKEAKRFIGS